jgi:hypothetical protein
VKNSPFTNRSFDILAGLQAGILGGLLMALWLALIAPVVGRPWWYVLNLLASYTYDIRAVRGGAGMATLTGIAIQVLAGGILGILMGVLGSANRVAGLTIAMTAYMVCYVYVWKRYTPFLLYSVPQPLFVTGFFLYGSVLSFSSRIAGGLRELRPKDTLVAEDMAGDR